MKNKFIKPIACAFAGLLVFSSVVPALAQEEPPEPKTTVYYFFDDEDNDNDLFCPKIPNVSDWKPHFNLKVYPNTIREGQFYMYKMYVSDHSKRQVREVYQLVYVDKVYDVPGPLGIGTERKADCTELETGFFRDLFVNDGCLYEIPEYVEQLFR